MSTKIETIAVLPASARLFVMESIVGHYQGRGEVAAIVSTHANGVESNLHQRGKVDASKVLFSLPDNAKQANEIIECLARSGATGVVIVEGFRSVMEDIFFSASLAEICGKSGVQIVHLQETRAEEVLAAEEEDRLAR